MDENKKAAQPEPEAEQPKNEACEQAAEKQAKPEKKQKKSKAEHELENLKTELAQQKDLFLRTVAEYDNYRKRTEKEKSQSVDYGISKAVTEILPVLDNLERAADAPCQDEEYKKGVNLTLKIFSDAMSNLGVKPIEAMGKPFDPQLHAAAQQLEAEGAQSGDITAVLQKGYTLNGKVIRHTVVAVAP